MGSLEQIVIHVGMPKTGSSAIQKTLAASRSALAEIGIHYPSTATRWDAHHILAWSARQARITSPEAPQIDQMLDSLSAELHGCNGTVVLSSEALFHIPASEMRPIIDWSRSQADRTVIVAYVRSPVEYREDWYRQRVKTSGYSMSLEDHLAQVPRIDVLRRLRELSGLGSDELLVRPFLRSCFPNGDVVEDFAAVIGAPGDSLRKGSFRNANASLNADLMEFKLRLNQAGVQHTKEIEQALRSWSIESEAQRRSLFSREQWNHMRDAEAPEHEVLLSEFDLTEKLRDTEPGAYTEHGLTPEGFTELLDEFRTRFPIVGAKVADSL